MKNANVLDLYSGSGSIGLECLSRGAKKVVFIDDVLYTGRSIRAGMDAINSFGRPKQIELLVLIDRRFRRELPIEPNYVGMTVDTIVTEKVVVEWDTDLIHKACVSLIRE